MNQNYVILQLATSLDGYIAKEDGNVDFLNQENQKLSQAFFQFLASVDVIVMGRNTYDKMLEFGEIPFDDKKIFVLTSRPCEANEDHVEFTNQSVLEWMKQKHGNIWLFGGAKLIQSFINHDLIDEFQIHIVPHIIGRGIPLFLPTQPVMNLSLCGAEQYDDSVTLIYKRKKP